MWRAPRWRANRSAVARAYESARRGEMRRFLLCAFHLQGGDALLRPVTQPMLLACLRTPAAFRPLRAVHFLLTLVALHTSLRLMQRCT